MKDSQRMCNNICSTRLSFPVDTAAYPRVIEHGYQAIIIGECLTGSFVTLVNRTGYSSGMDRRYADKAQNLLHSDHTTASKSGIIPDFRLSRPSWPLTVVGKARCADINPASQSRQCATAYPSNQSRRSSACGDEERVL